MQSKDTEVITIAEYEKELFPNSSVSQIRIKDESKKYRIGFFIEDGKIVLDIHFELSAREVIATILLAFLGVGIQQFLFNYLNSL